MPPLIDGETDRRTEELLAAFPPETVEPRAFFAAQFEAGLAFVHLPAELGGCGAPRSQQRRVNARLREAGAKSPALRNPIALALALPTLELHGSEMQKRAYFRAAFTSEEIWCQLFSEPGAGSDLAGLSARAVRTETGWRVTGQKVWTSMAHLARRGLLLARTDPDLPKHKGLTVFVVDMHSPGVEVRPLRQISGEAEFNEVFLVDVEIPDSDRVGGQGNGWEIARTTLSNERVMHSGDTGGMGTVGGSSIDRVLDRARELGVADPALRDRLVRLYMENRALRYMNHGFAAARRAGAPPGPEGALGKLIQGSYNQRLQQAALDLLGSRQIAWDCDDTLAPATVNGYLRAKGNTLEGGTTEILRNIVAEQALGLPRDPVPARDTPWSQLRRSG
jgi:alkylation response protein AidB-like acyl-CoA dehydrogenase